MFDLILWKTNEAYEVERGKQAEFADLESSKKNIGESATMEGQSGGEADRERIESFGLIDLDKVFGCEC